MLDILITFMVMYIVLKLASSAVAAFRLSKRNTNRRGDAHSSSQRDPTASHSSSTNYEVSLLVQFMLYTPPTSFVMLYATEYGSQHWRQQTEKPTTHWSKTEKQKRNYCHTWQTE